MSRKKQKYKHPLIFLFISIFLISVGLFINKPLLSPNQSFIVFAILKTVSFTAAFCCSLLFLFYLNKGGIKKIFKNFLVLIASILFIFSIGEIFFTFYTPSSNISSAYSHQLWTKRYFYPINSFGFRDEEPNKSQNKKNVFIIGDSFVAGHGLKYENMFTTILKSNISDKYQVFNLGKCGAHTESSFSNLLNYPIAPDIIILSYYHNDIESAMLKFNKMPEIKNPEEELFFITRKIINASLFANYIFSGFIVKPSITNQIMQSPNIDLLAYLDKELWDYQQTVLDKFYNYSIENDIEFMVLFFPDMGNGITFSEFIAGRKIYDYCKSNNIRYLSIFDAVKDLPTNKRIANPIDTHPSKYVNFIVADYLSCVLTESDIE